MPGIWSGDAIVAVSELSIPFCEMKRKSKRKIQERGRRAVAALEKGDWMPGKASQQPVATIIDQPNIFALYEQNIGPLTPLLSDVLRDAEHSRGQ